MGSLLKQVFTNVEFVTRAKWIGCLQAAYFFVFLLALTWLLPEVVQPWPGFEHEAWCAVVFALAGGYLMCRYHGRWRAPPAVGVLLLLACLPLLQRQVGVSAIAPVMALSSLYLFGFLLVYLLAFNAELRSPGRMLDALFLAIGLAAFVSVFIALRQWFEIFGPWDWWSLGVQPYRPYANLGQANHLGTLLCWGLCALGWGALQGQIGRWVGLAAACLLIFGVALTGSRSAWLGLTLCCLLVRAWRRKWPVLHVARDTGLLWLFLIVSIVVANVDGVTGNGTASIDERYIGLVGSPRLKIWGILLDAALNRPWFGYGWNQTLAAYLEVAPTHPPLHEWLPSAHNILLDIVLWCGIPLGLALCALLGWGFLRRLMRVTDASQAVLMLFVLLLANHAMLEYPLHYAYFLLPLACVLGCLDAKQGGDIQSISVHRAWVGVGWFTVTCALALLLSDYREIQVEKLSFLQVQGQKSEPGSVFASPTQPHFLGYWVEQRAVLYSPPTKGLSADALTRLENITRVSVNGNKVLRLAMLLALNEQPERAVWWLKRFCSIVDEVSCGKGQLYWQKRGQCDAEIAALPWPVEVAQPAPR